uniref:Uncharacterized protein n=1 Tax=Oryza brachyantha TaxID=4533 RepID=J3LMN8_ORYBR
MLMIYHHTPSQVTLPKFQSAPEFTDSMNITQVRSPKGPEIQTESRTISTDLLNYTCTVHTHPDGPTHPPASGRPAGPPPLQHHPSQSQSRLFFQLEPTGAAARVSPPETTPNSRFFRVQSSDGLFFTAPLLPPRTRSTTGNHAAAAAAFPELLAVLLLREEAPEQAGEDARFDLAAARQWPPRVVLPPHSRACGCCCCCCCHCCGEMMLLPAAERGTRTNKEQACVCCWSLLFVRGV